jgi:hypothetical protein
LPKSLDCNEDGRLKSNMDDQYSHKKMLQNGKFDVLKNLEEQFDESIYLSAQKQSLQHGIENNVDEVLEVS